MTMANHPNRNRVDARETARHLRWMPPETLYPDLERGADRLPDYVIAEARDWCSAGPTVWTPPRVHQNPAEIIAALGALWFASREGLDVRWDGSSLRGVNIMSAAAARTMVPGGKGGVHLGDLFVGLRRAKADLWAGQVTAARIWESCLPCVTGDWSATSLGLKITGFDPTTYALPIDLGFSADFQKMDIPARPAVEIAALLGAEALIRANSWQMEQSNLWLPMIRGIPLRDWRDARRMLRHAHRPAEWAMMMGSASAGAQRPMYRSIAIKRQGRFRRLGWII